MKTRRRTWSMAAYVRKYADFNAPSPAAEIRRLVRKAELELGVSASLTAGIQAFYSERKSRVVRKKALQLEHCSEEVAFRDLLSRIESLLRGHERRIMKATGRAQEALKTLRRSGAVIRQTIGELRNFKRNLS